MLLIKTFQNTNAVDLQYEVNLWLQSMCNKNVYIINTTQSESAFSTDFGMYHNITYTIIYKVD